VNGRLFTVPRELVPLVMAEGPETVQFVSAIPAPNSVQTAAGTTTLRWNFTSIDGPGKAQVKLTQRVQAGLSAGTALNLSAAVTAADGRSDQITKTVTVRD
jgi:hypothetical protein